MVLVGLAALGAAVHALNHKAPFSTVIVIAVILSLLGQASRYDPTTSPRCSTTSASPPHAVGPQRSASTSWRCPRRRGRHTELAPRDHGQAGLPGRRDLQPPRTRRPRAPVTYPEIRRRRIITTSALPSALRAGAGAGAGAEGIYALEAAICLIIAHGTWIRREDFGLFIHRDAGRAAIDGEATISTLDAGGLSSSGGRSGCHDLLPASPTRHSSASAKLSRASTAATSALVKAIQHAAG
jgi:hypothetical protein